MQMVKVCVRSQLSQRLKIKLQAVEMYLTSLLGIWSSETHCLMRYLNLSEMETKIMLLFENTDVAREAKQPCIFNLTGSPSLWMWEAWVHLSVGTSIHLHLHLPSSQLQFKTVCMYKNRCRIKGRIHLFCFNCKILWKVLKIHRVKSKNKPDLLYVSRGRRKGREQQKYRTGFQHLLLKLVM